MGKIIGLGLSKSGTTSRHRAFKTLGWNSVHYPHKEKIFVGHFSWLSDYDAVSDWRQFSVRGPRRQEASESFPGQLSTA